MANRIFNRQPVTSSIVATAAVNHTLCSFNQSLNGLVRDSLQLTFTSTFAHYVTILSQVDGELNTISKIFLAVCHFGFFINRILNAVGKQNW